MPAVIQVRRGQAATWTSANPMLSPGEFGYETDTGKLKIGDGFTYWNDLDYLPVAGDLATLLAGKQNTSEKGQNNGYAALDSTGKVPSSQLPITQAEWATLDGKPAVVAAGATQADARLAIGLDQVDNTADLDKPISTAVQTALDDKSDVGHGHTQSDILDLVTDLAGKEPTITSGTTADYWRGDKSWVTLDKTAVGLPDVDNTSDLAKPVSTATQTALDGKADVGHEHVTADITDLGTTLAGKQDISEKGQPGGYPELDGTGRIPIPQLPAGSVIDNVVVTADTFQLFSGDAPVGDPISLLISALDGGSPGTVTESRVDGGTLL